MTEYERLFAFTQELYRRVRRQAMTIRALKTQIAELREGRG